jgi:hypothetical protein
MLDNIDEGTLVTWQLRNPPYLQIQNPMRQADCICYGQAEQDMTAAQVQGIVMLVSEAWKIWTQ